MGKQNKKGEKLITKILFATAILDLIKSIIEFIKSLI